MLNAFTGFDDSETEHAQWKADWNFLHFTIGSFCLVDGSDAMKRFVYFQMLVAVNEPFLFEITKKDINRVKEILWKIERKLNHKEKYIEKFLCCTWYELKPK